MVIVTKRKGGKVALANGGRRKLGCIDTIVSNAASSLMGAIDTLTLEVFSAPFTIKLLAALVA